MLPGTTPGGVGWRSSTDERWSPEDGVGLSREGRSLTAVTPLRLLEPGGSSEVEIVMTVDDFWVSATDVVRVLGWEIKPEGLCRDRVCIPLSDRGGLIDDDMINLGRLAELIGRPLAVSAENHAAYLGQPFDGYERTVGHLDAPDFTLPDLDGRMHKLSDHRGSKILLAAWASW